MSTGKTFALPLISVAVLLLAGSACGEDAPYSGGRIAASVQVTPSSFLLNAGAWTQLQATVLDQNGDPFQTLPGNLTVRTLE
jgi:hypothetical protein